MNLINQINEHKYLYFDEIGEIDDNVLRLVIAEAIVGGEAEDLVVGTTVLSDLRHIISDETCNRYEIIFDHYVAYAVLNESYTSGDKDDPLLGQLFRNYSTSKFLDYVRVATFADEDYPGPFVHYQIVCLNHVVEIASVNQPLITQVTS